MANFEIRKLADNVFKHTPEAGQDFYNTRDTIVSIGYNEVSFATNKKTYRPALAEIMVWGVGEQTPITFASLDSLVIALNNLNYPLLLKEGTGSAGGSGTASAGGGSTNGLTDAQLRADPLPTITPLPATSFEGQGKIATTGVAVQLPSNLPKNGVLIKAHRDNAQPLFIGKTGVKTTDDGTGNGFALDAGEAVTKSVLNTNLIFINGAVGDKFYYTGE
jgi:hypothetical protein